MKGHRTPKLSNVPLKICVCECVCVGVSVCVCGWVLERETEKHLKKIQHTLQKRT